MRFSSAVQGFWLVRRRDLSPNTCNDYSLTFRRLTEYLNDPPFAEIGADDIHAFLNYWSGQLSKKTVANMWIALSSLWTWAETEPALRTPHIIRASVNQPKYTSPPVVPFVQEEIKRLLAATLYTAPWTGRAGGAAKTKRPTALRDRAILLVLLDSGMRNAEMCNLCIGDYNPDRGELRIHKGKGDKGRVVYVGQRSRRALWRYLAERGDPPPSRSLFATHSEGHMSRDSLYRMVQRTGERAGVEEAYPHRFRHTFAINYLRNGGDPLTLQRILGHESMSTVQIYVKLAEVDIERSQTAASPADNWRL